MEEATGTGFDLESQLPAGVEWDWELRRRIADTGADCGGFVRSADSSGGFELSTEARDRRH